jgi:division protein CdvB (Snf7/Vps24/ESCRT-III family)
MIPDIWKTVKGFVKMFDLDRKPLKEKIAHAVYRLECQRTKLQESSSHLQQRDREMFERCIGAKGANDGAHAIIYANECVEIRKMAKIVLCSELALERVILRLETIEEVGDLLVQMAPIVGIVHETKGRLKGIIPEVSQELEEINGVLNDTLIETGEVAGANVAIDAGSEEAKKILEEATAVAEQKMSENFPELPLPPTQPKQPEMPTPIVETEASGGEAEIKHDDTPKAEMPEVQTVQEAEDDQPLTPEELDRQIYNYILEQKGDLDALQCASTLKITVYDVKKTIDRLAEEGKIRLE